MTVRVEVRVNKELKMETQTDHLNVSRIVEDWVGMYDSVSMKVEIIVRKN